MNYYNSTYGLDILSLILILISSIFNCFPRTRFIAIVIMVYALYRCLSTYIMKRNGELQKFYSIMDKVFMKFNKRFPKNLPVFHFKDLSPIFNNIKYKFTQRTKFKIVSCPKCGQKLRLPRKKGHITVTCKKCKHEFKMKT